MRYSISIFALILCWVTAVGQSPFDPTPKAEKYFQKAKEAIRAKDGDKAIQLYQKAVKESPLYYEAQAQLAILLNRLGREDDAVLAMETLITIDPSREPYVYFQLGKLYFKRENWAKAATYLDQFLQFVDLDPTDHSTAKMLKEICQFRQYALDHPVPFQPIPFTAAVNSTGDEFNPTFTADGQRMVFTRNDGRQEDFYQSVWMHGEWQNASPLQDLNTAENEGAHCLSKDGRTMIFTSCNNRDGKGSCDLFETKWEDGQWSEPTNLGPQVNSRHWESQPTLSADGHMLIFSSKRPGNMGGADLWYTVRTNQGGWQQARLIPGMVNTPGDEETPFLHADGETLYFSSNGHPGMGLHDLFISRWSKDDGWLAPLNLGYPINTAEQEQAMTLGLDGKTAFFSSNRLTAKERPDYDLFTFMLPTERRGTPVTYVQGTVRSGVNQQGLAANIVFRSLDSSADASISVSATPDGHYLICLPAGDRYAVLIEHPGYSFFSQSFNLNDTLAFHPYEFDVELFPLEEDRPLTDKHIVLKNILFPSGSASLLPESTFELERILQFLQENQDIRVRIEGHTDNVGLPEDNLRLSKQRALSVVNWLLDHGIHQDRMSSAGMGETKPLVENDTVEHRQMNRRTELVILP